MIDGRRGSMPFALVAVSILLLASVSAAVAADHYISDNGVVDTGNGAEAIQEAIEDARTYMNQELGIIILDMSKDDSLGTVDQRAGLFKERASDWVDDRFPMSSRGVRLELVEREFALGAETMGSVGSEGVTDGYVPAYLRGTGAVVVNAMSQYGSTITEVDICTDGSYSLPLVAEQGSLFERMTEDGGISISQMVSYELQSLAQYRVLNGYGSKSQYGSKGTNAIITPEDVRTAYDRALELVGIICFRDSDGEIVQDGLDLADDLMGEYVTFDRSEFYGQILMSVLDDLVLKWFDYLCGNIFLDALDHRLSSYKLALDALISFFTGEDPFSAESYIVRVMEDNGVDPSVYRSPGSGFTSVRVGDYSVTVENPTSELMSKNWIKYFRVHYTLDSNHLQNILRQILNTAAVKVLGSFTDPVTIRLDPHDDISFVRTMTEAFKGNLSGFERALEDSVRAVTAGEHFYDEFYAAIADTVMAHEDEFMLTDELRDRIEESFMDIIDEEEELAAVLDSEEIDKAVHSYVSAVHGDLSVLDSLRYIDGRGPDILSVVLTEMASFGLRGLGTATLIGDRCDRLIDEIAANMDTNPYTGKMSLPMSDCFQLIDKAGNLMTERLDLDFTSDPVISTPRILTSKCTHMTGFMEQCFAGYSTTFEVRIRDCIDYTVTGTNSFSEAMGSGITSSLRGIILNDIALEISVGSAWALIGVEYSASSTILSDALQLLYKILDPIMEPLRKIMEIVKDVIVAINECIMEVVRYVSETLVRMYEQIIGPLTEVIEWVEENVDKLIGDTVLNMFYSLNLSEQSIGMEYMGYTFTMTFNLASLRTSSKTLFTATLEGPMAGMSMMASVTAKAKGELNPSNVFVTGKATVSSDDWKVKMSIDPLLRGSKHLLTVFADVRDMDITAILPDLDDYREIGLTLSKIPGVGAMLSNIPIPVLGVNIGLDAGLSLKYSAPIAEGLLINEFESNPAGNDSGNEWVELLNNTDKEIDLEGYSLVASSDHRNKVMRLYGSISPGEFLLIEPSFSMVNTSGKLTKNGEGLTLKDPNGDVVDKTKIMKDTADDGKTWQRSYDGSGDWEFKDATMGRSNGSYVSSNLLTVEVAKEIVSGAVQTAFGKVGSITSLETMQEVIQITVKETIESVIKKVAGCLVEASVFVQVDVMDITSSASGGVRVALRCDSDLVEDTLKYIAGKVESIALSMKNPYRIDGVAMFTDNIDLELTVGAKLQFPRILASAMDSLPKVDFGATFRSNISALTRLFGEDIGKPEVECGLRVVDCPTALIPPKLSPKNGMDHDLWLFKVTVAWD